MMSGDDLERMLNRTMETKTPCRKCGTGIAFEEGAQLAMKNGIRDKVVMCPKCNSVYEVNVTPRDISLLAEVTQKYAHQLTTSQATSKMKDEQKKSSRQASAIPSRQGDMPSQKKWWQFWK